METRQKLVDAAKTLNAQKNFADVMVEEITGLAGVAKGTFYTYFKRKEDVFSEIMFHKFDPIREQAQARQGDVAEQIASFLAQSMEQILEDRLELAQYWMKNAMSPGGKESLAQQKLDFDQGYLVDALAQAVKCRELCDETPVEGLAWEITATYYGMVALWCQTAGQFNFKDRMKEYAEKRVRAIINIYRRA